MIKLAKINGYDVLLTSEANLGQALNEYYNYHRPFSKAIIYHGERGSGIIDPIGNKIKIINRSYSINEVYDFSGDFLHVVFSDTLSYQGVRQHVRKYHHGNLIAKDVYYTDFVQGYLGKPYQPEVRGITRHHKYGIPILVTNVANFKVDIEEAIQTASRGFSRRVRRDRIPILFNFDKTKYADGYNLDKQFRDYQPVNRSVDNCEYIDSHYRTIALIVIITDYIFNQDQKYVEQLKSELKTDNNNNNLVKEKETKMRNISKFAKIALGQSYDIAVCVFEQDGRGDRGVEYDYLVPKSSGIKKGDKVFVENRDSLAVVTVKKIKPLRNKSTAWAVVLGKADDIFSQAKILDDTLEKLDYVEEEMETTKQRNTLMQTISESGNPELVKKMSELGFNTEAALEDKTDK